MNKSYAVFGLGRYGHAVAKELCLGGADVLAVDIDETLVNSTIVDVPLCKCADVTDPETIKKLGVAQMDVVIVAMANNLEASVMAIMLCKELGVPTVIAKCKDEIQGKILSRVGADKVVFPESESGIRLARNLLTSGLIDAMELTKGLSLVEMAVKPEWVNKTLLELALRKKYAMNIVAIRQNKDVTVHIDPTQPLTEDMQLITIIPTGKLNKLQDK